MNRSKELKLPALPAALPALPDDARKKPKYAIEFDDIHDIHVYVDGKEKDVSRLYINWQDQLDELKPKTFTLDTLSDTMGTETFGQRHD